MLVKSVRTGNTPEQRLLEAIHYYKLRMRTYPLSINLIAKRANISRNAVWRYLEILDKQERITPELNDLLIR